MNVQSVDRALQILALFSHSRPLVGISEIAQELGVSKGTAYNLVHTLERGGFVDQDSASRKYRLGVMSLAVGSIASGTLEINQRAAGPASYLAERTQLLCRVGIWKRGRAIVTLNAAPHSRNPFQPFFGPVIPAYCTVIGKVLLAYLPPEQREEYLDRTRLVPYTDYTITDRGALEKEFERIRQTGHAVANQEIASGRAALAVPILGPNALPIAALALSGEVTQILDEKYKASYLSELASTAHEISSYLGGFPVTLPE